MAQVSRCRIFTEESSIFTEEMIEACKDTSRGVVRRPAGTVEVDDPEVIDGDIFRVRGAAGTVLEASPGQPGWVRYERTHGPSSPRWEDWELFSWLSVPKLNEPLVGIREPGEHPVVVTAFVKEILDDGTELIEPAAELLDVLAEVDVPIGSYVRTRTRSGLSLDIDPHQPAWRFSPDENNRSALPHIPLTDLDRWSKVEGFGPLRPGETFRRSPERPDVEGIAEMPSSGVEIEILTHAPPPERTWRRRLAEKAARAAYPVFRNEGWTYWDTDPKVPTVDRLASAVESLLGEPPPLPPGGSRSYGHFRVDRGAEDKDLTVSLILGHDWDPDVAPERL